MLRFLDVLKRVLLAASLLSAPAVLFIFYKGIHAIKADFGLLGMALFALLGVINLLGIALLIDESRKSSGLPPL